MALVSERLGRLAGLALSPLTGAVAGLRRSRMFHPEGLTFRADVAPCAVGGPHEAVAARLSGPALLRFSSAWWKREKEWIDALGLAVRFRDAAEVSPAPGSGDQDLLAATIRSPWTTLLAPLTTDVHDFLANDYYAVSPFAVTGLGSVKLRWVCSRPRLHGSTRAERLRLVVSSGLAVLELQSRELGWRRPWTPLARMTLLAEVSLDQQALRFSPFRAGRGLEPRGFVHALRHATYGSSQFARSARARR